ncbi:hypothetical protein KBX06_13055 [Micromonospora sp. C31]|uniref:hypothetical protein n=1 Tax=Micromonospora sp. C31 TaxID=2824876 RepID=UPI001B3988EE|nr:hypothetical protein [Micromonospora sp. C31]MBQ1074082.1 hypothetical protein [Micromonospora sp. C31]
MTAGGFREVDHDLLADYLGGALDGTPDEDLVARLVDEDADWAQAYALLGPAVADVRAGLAAWGSAAPEMPTDVADRIVAALAHATAAGNDTDAAACEPGSSSEPVLSGKGRSEPGPSGSGREGAGHDGEPAEAQPAVMTGVGVVPTQPLGGSGRRPAGVPRSEPGPGGTTGPGRRRRRWNRLAGPVALAAVSIAAVGLGVSQFSGSRQTGGAADTALPDTAHREEAGPAAATPFRVTGEPSVRSGTDYTPESLAALPASPKSRPYTAAPPVEQPGVQAEGGRRPDSAVGLERLTDPAALGACIGAITAEHGNGPLVVDVVDYARFQGRPALIVRFTDATGAGWAWASGPECGVPGSGSDSRHRTRVG